MSDYQKKQVFSSYKLLEILGNTLINTEIILLSSNT